MNNFTLHETLTNPRPVLVNSQQQAASFLHRFTPHPTGSPPQREEEALDWCARSRIRRLHTGQRARVSFSPRSKGVPRFSIGRVISHLSYNKIMSSERVSTRTFQNWGGKNCSGTVARWAKSNSNRNVIRWESVYESECEVQLKIFLITRSHFKLRSHVILKSNQFNYLSSNLIYIFGLEDWYLHERFSKLLFILRSLSVTTDLFSSIIYKEEEKSAEI